MADDPSQRGVMPRVFQYLCAQIAREERKSADKIKFVPLTMHDQHHTALTNVPSKHGQHHTALTNVPL
jgi:hypothetical protein